LATTKLPTNEVQGTSGSVCNRLFVGDFSQLMVAFRSELRVEILKERYAEYLQYGFLGYLRADINVTHPEGFAMVIGILP
jgi:HK97 family phage major capsid protein